MKQPLATNNALFKAKIPARDKAEQTTFVARTIADTETTAREKKTARLKALRLEREAADLESPPAPKPKVAKAPSKPKAAPKGPVKARTMANSAAKK